VQKETKLRIANLVSNILNPFLLALVIIMLLALKSRPTILSALRWSLVLAVVSILPVMLVVMYLVRKGRMGSLFPNVRRQRTEIYLLAGAFTVIDYIVLLRIHAPTMLIAGVVTALFGLILFMCINLWWGISLHTAFMTGLATISTILYGWIGTSASVLVLLVGWSRIELKEHTLTQVIAGAFLAALVVIVTFHLFGFI
jgi:membrane-associated phospholipid phosphatase